MFRKSDGSATQSVRFAKREMGNSAPYVRSSPVFINSYSGSIGSVPVAGSGLNRFGVSQLNSTGSGTTQVPAGFTPANLGSGLAETDANTGFGMTALLFGLPGNPIGSGEPMTRAMFVGVGGIQFNDAQADNAIQVSHSPVHSPEYWMSV